MGVGLQDVKFHVEDDSWGSKKSYKIHGLITASVWVEVGSLLTETLDLYKEYEFTPSKLPKEIQDKMVDVYNDIEKFLKENCEIKLKG